MKHNNYKKGFISIEMIGIIALIAMIAAGGAYYISTMNRDSKVIVFTNGLSMINTKVSEIRSPVCTKIPQLLFDLNALPKGFIYNAEIAGEGDAASTPASISTPLGDIVFSNGDSKKECKVTLDSISPSICKNLMSRFSVGDIPWKEIENGSNKWTEGDGDYNDFCQKSGSDIKLAFTIEK